MMRYIYHSLIWGGILAIFFINISFANEEKDINERKKFLNLKKNEKVEKEERIPKENDFRVKLLKPIDRIDKLRSSITSLDPVKFTMVSDKDSVQIGDEIELTVTADLLPIPPGAFFIFEEQKSFSLKLLLPKGFVQTGGTYYEYIGGRVDEQNPKMTFTIKGYFESVGADKQPCFELLRSGKDANANSVFESKGKVCLMKKKTETALKQASNARLSATNSCEPLIIFEGYNCFQKNQNIVIQLENNGNTYGEDVSNSVWVTDGGDVQAGGDGSAFIDLKFSTTGTKTVSITYGNNLECITNIQFQIIDPLNISISGSTSLIYGQSTTLTINNCPGNASWEDLNRNVLSNVNSLTITPHLVTTYKAKCVCGANTDEETVTVSVRPSASASATEVCSGSEVTLSSEGCGVNSTITWYKNRDWKKPLTGNKDYPTIHATYNALCSSGNNPTIDESSNVSVTVNAAPSAPSISSASRCGKGTVTLTATGCDGGTIRWYDSSVSFDDMAEEGSSLTSDIDFIGSLDIYARCWKNGCYSNAATATMTAYANPTPTVNSPTICAGGTASLTVSNCSGNVTWNTGATGATLNVSPSSTTTYTATCTVGSCSGTATATVTVNANPTPTVNSPTICAGGTASLTVSNCSGNVIWNTGATGATLNVSPSSTTTYTATCTVGSCSGTATATVTVNANPTPTVNSPTICAGGTASLTVSNCSGNVTWNTGATGATLNVSPSSTTTYTATCTVGSCSGTATATVTVNANPTPTVNSPTICAGGTASLTVSNCSGNVTWNTGATGATLNVSPSSTTTYTATCTVGSCSGTATATVTVNANPTPTVNSPTICAGGTASLTVSNCTGGSVTWNNGLSGNPATTPVLTANASYTATCTLNGCSRTATANVTVNANPSPTVNSPTICSGRTASLTVSNCTGGSVTWNNGLSGNPATTPVLTANASYTATCTLNGCSRTATANVTVNANPSPTVNSPTICSGRTASLTVSNCSGNVTWSNGLSGNPATTPVLTANASYTATCTLNGCSSTATANVTVNANPTPTVNSPTICSGGTASLTVSNCTGGSVTWNNGLSGNPATTPVLTANASYTATCTLNGCSGTATANVTVNANPSPTVNSPTICSGGTASLTVSNCTGGSVTWNNGLSGNPATTPVLTANASYTATCTLNGCSRTATANVTVNANPSPTVNSPTICSGGTASLTVSNCSGNVTWSNGLSGNPATTPVLTANASYTATCTLNGCSRTATANVTVNPALNPFISNQTICFGESVTLTVLGCSGTVVWDNNATGLTRVVSPTTTKNYWATCKVTTNGVTCSATTTGGNVTVNPKLVIADGSAVICEGSSVNLTSKIPNYSTYFNPVWKQGGTIVGTPASVIPIVTTTYTLIAENASGCKDTANVAVTVNANPSTPTADSVWRCREGEVTLTANGCLGTRKARWFETLTGGNPVAVGATYKPVIPATKSYYVECYDTLTTCSSPRTTIKAIVRTSPKPIIVASKTRFCNGDTPTLSVTNCSSGMLRWSDGQNASSIVVQPRATTTYWVICQSQGCISDTSKITLTVDPIPSAPIITAQNGKTTLCKGESVTLTAGACTGGNVSWSQNPRVVAPQRDTTYYVTCTVNGCVSPAGQISIKVNPVDVAPVVVSPVIYCINETSVALTATGTNLKWYAAAANGTALTSPVIPSTAAAGTVSYYVSQSNIFNCESPRAKIEVTVHPRPAAPTVPSAIIYYCQFDNAVALTATGTSLKWYRVASGGSAMAGAPVPSTSTVDTVDYYVSQTNGFNCEGPRTKVRVIVKLKPAPPAVTAIAYCQNTVAVALQAGNVPGSTLKWYNVPTGGTASSTAPIPPTNTAGIFPYYVSQTLNGCESNRNTLQVTIFPQPALPTAASPIEYCHNTPATPLTATGTRLKWYTANTGGTPLATAPTPSTATVGITDYYVTQTDTVRSCEGPRKLIRVEVLARPAAPLTDTLIVYCQKASAVALTATGTNLKWYLNANGGSPVTGPVVPSTATPGQTFYYVSQTDSKGCESAARTRVKVLVHPTPAVVSVANAVYCINRTASPISLSGSPSNALLTWTVNSPSVANSLGMNVTSGTGMIPSFLTKNAGNTPLMVTISVTPTANGCTGPVSTFRITVNPKPIKPGIVASRLFTCPADTVLLTAANIDGELRWSTGASVNGTIKVTPTATTTYWAYNSKDNCPSDTSNRLTVNVSQLEFDGKLQLVCNDTTRTGTVTATVKNANANWVVTYRLERMIAVNTTLVSDSVGLWGNSRTFSKLTNGIYRVQARQRPADISVDQVGQLCISYSDTINVQCRRYRKARMRYDLCGRMTPIEINEQGLLTNLMVGDTLWASDFDVIVTRVMKSGNMYFGDGYTYVPKLLNAKVKMRIDSAIINKDFELIGGKVYSIYDPNWRNILDVNAAGAIAGDLGEAFKNAVDSLFIDTPEERASRIAKDLRKFAQENLPDELLEDMEEALQEMEAAKAAYRNAANNTERQAAKMQYDTAKAKLNALQNQKDNFINDFVNIIKQSLGVMLTENNSTVINTQKTILSNAANQLGFSLTNLQKMEDLLPNGIVIVEESGTGEEKDPKIKTFYTEEYKYNKMLTAGFFASKMNSNEGAKQVGETLKKNGKLLSQHIYERKKATPAPTNQDLVNEVKDIIYGFLDTLLNDEVYSKK